jgi:hypothetical protein
MGVPRLAVDIHASNFPLSAAPINLAATGALVAASIGKVVRVYKMLVAVATTTTITFADGATALSGAITLSAGAPLVLPFDTTPWMQTSPGNALNITLGSSVQTSGIILYTQD